MNNVKSAIIEVSNSHFTYPYSGKELRAALKVIHNHKEYLKRYTLRQFVYERDKYTCRICRADVSDSGPLASLPRKRTAAHIIPHQDGLVECGLDPKFLKSPDNLVTTCVGKCNTAAEWNREFLKSLLPILEVSE